MSLISIVIPAYNEEEAIGQDLDVIIETMDATGYDYEIVVVDDGSTDATAQIARTKKGVRLVQHSRNKGPGAARKTGILHAKGDVIVMTDADGTYPNHHIPRLLAQMSDCDMVIGVRSSEAGTWPALRAPAKWFIRKLASYIGGTEIPDLNSGFRAFKRSAALKFFNILPSTHSWVATITLAFLTNDYEVRYIPIDYHRRKGKSSFHPIRDTYNYLTLVFRTMMYFDPFKVFVPLALTIFAAGMARLIYHAVAFQDVRETDIMIVLVAIIVGVMGALADIVLKGQKHFYVKRDDGSR